MGPQDGVDRVVGLAHYLVKVRGRSDIRFSILSDGECLNSVRWLARELNVDSFITFAGWVDLPNLQSYLSTADVCLAPEPVNIYNQRSSFIKLTEYMRYGKVTVSSDLLE